MTTLNNLSNLSSSTLSDQTSSDGLSPATTALSQQAPDDFTGDGLSDILWRNSDGDVGMWVTDSGINYTVVDFNMTDPTWIPQGGGDFNGDGKTDVLWRNTNGEVGYWLANTGTGYTGWTAVDLSNVENSWQIQGTGSFDGSAVSDILWRNTNGDTGAWLMDGQGGYTAVDFGTVDNSWSIQGVGDFNGDGKSDILWRNSNGAVGWWLSNSGTGYTGWTPVTLATVESAWSIVGVGDFTGTGQSDILWRNTDGALGFWSPNSTGSGYTAVNIQTVDPSWTVQAVGDFNGDGKADILWRNSDGAVGEWISTAGAGFTGFTAQSLATVPPTDNWSVVGNAPALGSQSGAQFAQAMASMPSGGSVTAAAATAHQTATQPLIAAPVPHAA